MCLRMHCGFKGSDQGQPVLCDFKARDLDQDTCETRALHRVEAGGFHNPNQQGRLGLMWSTWNMLVSLAPTEFLFPTEFDVCLNSSVLHVERDV